MIIYDNEGRKVLDITVDDSSYRNRVIMGDNNVTLHYSLPEHIELPIGAYCVFENARYTLMRPESFKMKHGRNFEYTVILEAPEAKAKMWKFRNPVDARLKFSLTAKPKEHLQMFVDNMNRRDTGWTIGECIDGVEITINYDHVFCYDALSQMASETKTEFEFNGKSVSLRKVVYNKNNPLPLSYGRGNGFKPNVGRSNYGDNVPVEILFVQGGTDNIDRSKYGNRELLLPKLQTLQYDGEFFEDEDGFNPDNARMYITDDLGLSIRRADKELSSLAEDSIDCSSIYPKRIGTVSSVIVEDAENNFYDIVDNSIPAALNYEDYLIADETMTIIFQSGMLAGDGKEFEVKYIHEIKDGKPARRFEITPQTIDGEVMPNEIFCPKDGDTYVVYNCMLPDAYICDNETKTGASWDMFREAVRYMFDNEDVKFSFTGELDGIWAKKDWTNIGGRIKLGGYIKFSDEHFQKEGVLVRITGIKDYINSPHSPELTLSNSTVSSGFSTTLNELKSEEVLVEDYHRSAIQYTKRRFRDAKETISMLEEALLDNFTNSINPIAVQTMSMLVGDESLQFRFVKSLSDLTQIGDTVKWNNDDRQLTIDASVIQHLTLGIKDISSNHNGEYKVWSLPAYTSAILLDGTKKYYLYAKCSVAGNTGEFTLSETAIPMKTGSDYYLLVGVLNSEYDGERSFASLYGFSEVLPGRITTDRIVSGTGTSYFDMLNNAMKLGDVLDFNSKGDGKLRLKGTIVQSESGDESLVGVYRGVYNSSYTYYNGDEVSYSLNEVTSTYRYIGSTPSKNIPPTNSAYWQVQAAGVKGDQGEQGIAGEDGADGRTSYFHVKYADDATGKNMNETGGDYIGTYVDFLPDDSNDPSKYTWVKTKGAQGDKGDQGIAGINGEDGQTSYLHIAYANSEDGTTGFSVSDSTGKLYIGQYVDFVKTDSTDPKKYKWSKIKGDKGDQGEQGIAGEDGADGRTSYFHIKYSEVETPTAEQMTETPSTYIGTYVDFTEADSNDPQKYNWSRFQGYKGDTGIAGVNGEDGKTSYLHIKYSNDGGKTFSSKIGMRKVGVKSLRFMGNGAFRFTDDDLGEVEGDYIGTYVDYEPQDSTDVFRYKWVKIKGNQGDTGDYYEYRYAKNGSTSTPPTINKTAVVPDGWSTVVPDVGDLEYLWVTMAKISGNGEKLLQEWSTPVRFTPVDGKDGEQGYSPALVFRGVYDASNTYYGNKYRVDAVKYGSSYYVARVDAGTFSGIVPTNVSKWNSFGASFESVATNLLLAENANIAGWIFRNNRLESEDGTIWLDGINGQIMARGGFSGILTAENLFMPFVQISESKTLQKSDPTNIILHGIMNTPYLTLPENDSFNGMFLNIFLRPLISRMDAPGALSGKIMCPNKGTVSGSYVKEYYASQITSRYGGIIQLLNIEGKWILLNGSNLLEYTEYQ